MQKSDLAGYMEFKSFLPEEKLQLGVTDLVKHMDRSQIQTFGWPVGPVIHTKEWAPLPGSDGIKCLIQHGRMFDYWTLKKDGQFYVLKSLFEDTRYEGRFNLDTRIIRTMEALWRTARLYQQMTVSNDSRIECELEYGGLKNRTLTVANPSRLIMTKKVCHENTYKGRISSTVGELLSVEGLTKCVQEYCSGLFVLFEYFELKQEVTEQIVKAYYAGRTT